MSAPAQLFDVPGPRARRVQAVAAALIIVIALGILGWAIAVLATKGVFEPAKWTVFLTASAWKNYLLPGLLGTLKAAAISVVTAGALGLALGIGRLSEHRPVRWICSVFVEFFRAVPVLMMMLFAFAVVAYNKLVPSSMMALTAVVVGLTLYNGAVIAELVRSGVHNVARGQREAALSIGLTPSQTLRYVLLPQALTAMLPALVSQLVVVLKDSALGYIITYEELLRAGTTQLATAYNTVIPSFIVVAALFIAMNSALSWGSGRLQRYLMQRGHTAGRLSRGRDEMGTPTV